MRAHLSIFGILLVFFFLTNCGGGGSSTPPCGDYPPAGTSVYILPYPVNQSYIVSQANCGSISHHQQSDGDLIYAYDFNMAIGDEIIASRGGTVWGIREDVPDGTGDWSNINYVIIEHNDGTFGRYMHIMQNGALVNKGDGINRGQTIALSGDTGIPSPTPVPHLHFDVMKRNPDGTFNKTIPITFHNANPPAPTDTGLDEGTRYTAMPY